LWDYDLAERFNSESIWTLCFVAVNTSAKDFEKAFEDADILRNQAYNCLKFNFCDKNAIMKYGLFYNKTNGLIAKKCFCKSSDGKIMNWNPCGADMFARLEIIDNHKVGYNSNSFFFDTSLWEFSEGEVYEDKDKYRIWELINKSNHNEIEERILRAIEWIGMAIDEPTPTISFIQCVFAVECLLKYEKKETINKSIVAQISEYIAFIVGKNKENRKEIDKKFKDLYALRSKIAHGNNTDELDNELQEIIWLTKQIVINLLLKPELREIESMEKLRDWIEDMRYFS